MLTEQKRRFAYQIVTTGNLKKAADFVGIDIETAAEWFADDEINEIMIHDRKAALTTSLETRERIVARYAVVANVDIGDYFMAADDPGVLIMKPLNHLTKEQRQCIKKIKATQWGIEFEVHDAQRANDKLAEIHKLFDENSDDQSADDKAKLLRDLAAEMEEVTAGVVTH